MELKDLLNTEMNVIHGNPDGFCEILKSSNGKI